MLCDKPRGRVRGGVVLVVPADDGAVRRGRESRAENGWEGVGARGVVDVRGNLEHSMDSWAVLRDRDIGDAKRKLEAQKIVGGFEKEIAVNGQVSGTIH